MTEVQQICSRNGMFWKVTEDLASSVAGDLQSSIAEPDNQMPPRRGWRYYAGSTNGHQLDPDLKVEPFVEDPWCSTITVTAIGRASVKKHAILGRYRRTEFWSNGKPVRYYTFLRFHKGKMGDNIFTNGFVKKSLQIFPYFTNSNQLLSQVYKLVGGEHFLLHYPNKLGWSIRFTENVSCIR